MKPENLELSLEDIAKSVTCYLTRMFPYYKFDNGNKTDEIIGYNYECALPDNMYEKIVVKVEEKVPSIASETLEEGSIPVTFEGFVGKFYKDFKTNSYKLSCKAKSILILDN